MSGPSPPFGTSSGLFVSLPWGLGAARRNSVPGHEKAADACLRSCSEGRTTACDPHALGGDQCGDQRGSHLEHNSAAAKQAHTLSSGSRCNPTPDKADRHLLSHLKRLRSACRPREPTSPTGLTPSPSRSHLTGTRIDPTRRPNCDVQQHETRKTLRFGPDLGPDFCFDVVAAGRSS